MGWCENAAFISSHSDCQRGSGLSASIGSAVHKALECLARERQCRDAGEALFFEPELATTFPADSTPDDYLAASLRFYSGKSGEWKKEDEDQARKWLFDTISYAGGAYDPRKLNVVAPEQYFDLEIREPWAYYDYQIPKGHNFPDGHRLQGYLRIKGTMDLVTRVGPGLLHYIDWKTGAPLMDWATKRRKPPSDLRKDPQFLMYYYALRRLYPEDECFFTVYFCREGPFPICFDDEDLAEALRVIRHWFERIRGTTRPRLVELDARQKWKCKPERCNLALPYKDTGQSACHYFRDRALQVGTEGVFAEAGSLSALTSYGSGGGQENREQANGVGK